MGRKLIFWAGIVLICVFSILIFFVLVQFLAVPARDNIVPIPSSPVSYTEDQDNNANVFELCQYALITSDDTIAVIDNNSDLVFINLERKNWKNIKMSPDGKLISALSDSGNGVFDLNIFNTATKKWENVTSYSSLKNGVLSYVWLNNSVILFTQGLEPDLWLHSLNYSAGSQILKINRINGAEIKINKDRTVLSVEKKIENAGSIFSLYDTKGNLLYALTNITDENNTALRINRVYFATSRNETILETEFVGVYNLFSHTIGNKTAKPVEANQVVPVCSFEDNSFLFISEQGDGSLRFTSYSLENKSFTDLSTVLLEPELIINLDTSFCYNSESALLNFTSQNANYWYNFETDSAVKNDQLDGFIEVTNNYE